MIGTRLGAYEIVEEIGRGGMATVYRAYQPSVDRFVAVKVIEKTTTSDPVAIERFQREARLIARLEHLNILPVYDFDGLYQPPYIVMRYLDGGTLKDILNRGQLPLNEVVFLFRQIATALDYAHRQGIIHRDIKPSNIMIDREGNAFVSDFGIARMNATNPNYDSTPITRSGAIVGTPGYMPPEQVMGYEEIDHRADVYALGVMLFQMVTGSLPFEGERPMEIMIQHLHERVPLASERQAGVPPALDQVIQRAMAKEPEDRYASAGELLEAVIAAAGSSTSNIQLRRAAEESALIILERREQMKDQIDATLASFRKQRSQSQTNTNATPTEQNKLVTVLYVNVAEYGEVMDEVSGLEAAHRAIAAFLDQAVGLVGERGGTVFSQGEHDLMAVWGADYSREDDAEQAIHAALQIREALQTHCADLLDEDELFPIKIGLHTGMALLTPVSDTGSYSASGATISLTTRLAEQAEGSIRISHETYRYVRGVFDAEEDVPLKVRGRRETIPTYRIERAKARAFRMASRGVQGVETAMIGREAELKQLQNAFEDAVEEQETQVITILSEAGLGKSRLLYEFAAWAELHPVLYWIFRGRAGGQMMQRPYALLRDMISFRFQILDSDAMTEVQHKLESGVELVTGQPDREMAHLIGYLIGFDMDSSPHIKAMLNDPQQLSQRARQLFKQMIIRACDRSPVLIQLEDVHMADEASLLLLNELVAEHPDLPLIMVCLARPILLDRLQGWGTGQKSHHQITLEPLSRRESRNLINEILQKMPEVPAQLRDTIVEQADGNPYFIEETIKMLIEDRVILVDEERWTVEESRLKHLRVPPSLVSLIQARLDTLLYPEKLLLQRASVIGRIFYDSFVQALEAGDDVHLENMEAVLDTLVKREFIHQRLNSAFEGSTEYIFAQAMLRDAVYDSLLKRQLLAYHHAAAEWLVQTAGKRADEYLPLIAEHFLLGDNTEQAIEYLMQAGDRALLQGAHADATLIFEKIIHLLPETDTKRLIHAKTRFGEALKYSGRLDEAQTALLDAANQAQAASDNRARASALYLLGGRATELGEFQEALAYLEEALLLATQDRETLTLGHVLLGLANVYFRLGDYEAARQSGEQCLQIARETNNQVLEVQALVRLGAVLAYQDIVAAQQYLENGLALARKIGHKRMEMGARVNLGHVALESGEFLDTIAHCQAALDIAREVDEWIGIIVSASNIAVAYQNLDETEASLPYVIEMIRTARRAGAYNYVVASLGDLARWLISKQRYNEAASYLGAVKAYKGSSSDTLAHAEETLRTLQAHLSLEEIEAGLEAGKTLDVDAAIDAFLAEVDQSDMAAV